MSIDLVAEPINRIQASYIDGSRGDPSGYVRFSGILSTSEMLQTQKPLLIKHRRIPQSKTQLKQKHNKRVSE